MCCIRHYYCISTGHWHQLNFTLKCNKLIFSLKCTSWKLCHVLFQMSGLQGDDMSFEMWMMKTVQLFFSKSERWKQLKCQSKQSKKLKFLKFSQRGWRVYFFFLETVEMSVSVWTLKLDNGVLNYAYLFFNASYVISSEMRLKGTLSSVRCPERGRSVLDWSSLKFKPCRQLRFHFIWTFKDAHLKVKHQLNY